MRQTVALVAIWTFLASSDIRGEEVPSVPSLTELKAVVQVLTELHHLLCNNKASTLVSVQGYNNGRLQEFSLLRRRGNGEIQLELSAKEAVVKVDTKNRRVLIHVFDAQVDFKHTRVWFRDHVLSVPLLFPQEDGSLMPE